MANKKMDVAIIISAYDKASRIINNVTSNAIKQLNAVKKTADQFSKNSFAFGRDAGSLGLAGAATLAGPIKSFADLEEAALSLKSVMMKDGGVLDSKQFNAVSKLAGELGDKLPGNTKDFYEMFDTMIRNGIPAKNILDGTGKSAAYLAVALKLPYAEAGRLAAKLKEATGTSDKDMMDFMDTIARTANVGVESGEMSFAFARSAGALKLMKLQGLEASKGVSAVYASLIKTGASGETVGTGMSAVFNAFLNKDKMEALNNATKDLGVNLSFVDEKTGSFKGVENMIEQFDKLKGFNTQQRANVVQAFLGPGADANFMNILIDNGVEGYDKMIDKMSEQAKLNAKVESQLKGITAMWEAATGTFTNVLAMVGGLVSDDLRNMFTYINNNILPAITKWINNNKGLTKGLVFAVGIFTAVAFSLSVIGFVAGGVAKGISVMSTVFSLVTKGIRLFQFALFAIRYVMATSVIPTVWAFTAALFANPITWIVIGILAFIAVLVLLVVKWKEIVAYFKSAPPIIKLALLPLMIAISPILLLAWGIRKLVDNWSKITPVFKAMYNGARQFVMPVLFIIENMFTKVFAVVKKFLKSAFNIGKTIMKMLWNGMNAAAAYPVKAIESVVTKIRAFLPFSPAKVGPFRDLHKVKIVETIAKSMNPTPLVKAMANTTKSAASVTGISSGSMRSGGSAGHTFVFSPTISGGGGNIEEIRAMIRREGELMFKVFKEKLDNKQRVSFSTK